MGNFTEHIQHSKNNIDFLSKVNEKINDRWDWQVTTCFYSALHLINAHIVDKTQRNYLSHNQVSVIINPHSQMSVAKLDEDTYLSYTKLSHLSRRARYLLNEGFKKEEIVDIQPACITYSRHFRKSIYHLDKIIDFMKKNYDVDFIKKKIRCNDLKGLEFSNFIILS